MARLTLILGVLATVVYLLDGFRFMLNEWRNWRNKGKWLVVAGLALMPSVADAACSGSSPTLTAASAGRTDVQDCVTAAVSGDRINVPAGSATWASAIDVITKNISVIGAGSGSDPGTSTVLTITGECFRLADNGGTSSSSRIAHFRLIGCDMGLSGLDATKAFRVDHNYFQSASTRSWNISGADSIAAADAPSGLFDHNTFELVRLVIYGTVAIGTDDELQRQHKIWSRDPGLGGSKAIYVEDNEFLNSAVTDAWPPTDCNQSGRYVFRFNTVSTNAFYVNEVHGVQGPNRACQRWEIYGNSYTDVGSDPFTSAFIRGGSGTFFRNTSSGYSNGPALKVERVTEDKPSFGFCDGVLIPSTLVDGLLGSGYPCRDAIGRAQDSTLYTGRYPYSGTVPYPSQVFSPVYGWQNLQGGANVLLYRFNGTATHNAENRDFYNAVSVNAQTSTTSPFDGTVGVGHGTLANRPTTCTTTSESGGGVGYWATDQGSWNVSTTNPYGVQFSGEDGVLYRCSSTNTWTSHYTPYTYPHPLNVADAGPPASSIPGASVTGRVLRWMEVASIITGLSWHFRRPLLAVCLAAISLGGTLVQLAPKSVDTVKLVSRDSAVKVLTVFNHLTKPRP